MANRVDALLAELTARHGVDPAFMAQVRPAVEQVLAEDVPESLRVELLELVAETCERQVQMTRDLSVLQDGVARLFENLARLVRQSRRD